MKLRSLLIICGLSLLSCNSADYVEDNSWKKCYFDFDAVTHYRIAVTESEISEVRDKNGQMPDSEQLWLDVIDLDLPQDISDSLFVYELEEIGFEKSIVPDEKHEDIKDLFREKGFDYGQEYWMCIAIYRDILVFRDNNAITGIAKICFECDQSQIVGTDLRTDNFGAFNSFQKLYKILYE